MIRILTILVAIFLFTPVAMSQVKLGGQFKASQICPALLSIKKGTNPGDVSISVGSTYRLLGKNKDVATHLWIEIPGANPRQRWVALACGSTDVDLAGSAPSTGGAAVDTPNGSVKPKPLPKGSKDGKPFYVLALSWQPAFCQSKPDKIECRTQTASRPDATEFTLHGLWPQPRRNVFCGVDRTTAALDDQHQWDKLPAPDLSIETKVALATAMPGTQSLLERHEWVKHGTCYPGGTAEQYFKDAIRLARAVNDSVVQDFVAANIGKSITTSDLRAKFDEAFGKGAGERVRVACSRDGLISELTIGLKGDIAAGTSLPDLIAASEPTDSGCPQGVVDAVN
jgi:ribonuclease T2